MKPRPALRSILLSVLLAGPCLTAARGDPVASTPVWKDGVAILGSVRVDPKTRTVLATGWVNQVAGAIELLACGKGGKTHESVFVLDINPLDLQTGLLLLGLEPGTPPTGLGQGSPGGPELEIRVDWEVKGKTRTLPAERFVRNVATKKPLPAVPWLFTGSLIEDGEFKALAEESLVATYWDPWAIINIGTACGMDDEILYVNTRAVPPLNTPITMRFQPRARRTGRR
ncbi:MAG: hypothetical protein KJ726_03560 [Verrucomicrobia bacterium]|nr:hypothetical protein [Verrucomicrobiota bacterium]MBU1909103.1 hypothetical protein [Verrucomicrobiota bacterium]